MVLMVILNPIRRAHDACASDKSDWEKYPASEWITLIVTFFGSCIPFIACCKASKLDDPSDLRISLSSASLFPDLSPAMNCCTADWGDRFLICSLMSAIFACASFSFFTTSMMRPGSGRSVIPRSCTGSPPVTSVIFCPFRSFILLTLP